MNKLTNKLKIVFMGSSEFSADILRRLIDEEMIDVVAVYTRPDAVRGRGKKLVPSVVKELAINHEIEVQTPLNFKESDEVCKLVSYSPDFICVAAYGVILPQTVLDIPKYECLNVHGSLLPKWRGAAPVQRAILAGDKQSGASIMRMEQGMDTGDYCVQTPFDIQNKYVDEVFKTMAKKGADDMISSMYKIVNGEIKWTIQDESLVTYADKIDKRELWLRSQDSSADAYRKVLASSSAAPSKCNIAGRNVTLIKTKLLKEDESALTPLVINFSDGRLEILELKPDGKNAMDAKSFLSGIKNYKDKNIQWSEVK